MKARATLGLLAAASLGALAQDAQPVLVQTNAAPAPSKAAAVLKTPPTKPSFFVGETKVLVGGFLGELSLQTNVLQAINPFNPKNPGPDGKNVSYELIRFSPGRNAAADPTFGRPLGFKLLSFEF